MNRFTDTGRRFFLGATLLAALAGCGQTGALYQPAPDPGPEAADAPRNRDAGAP